MTTPDDLLRVAEAFRSLLNMTVDIMRRDLGMDAEYVSDHAVIHLATVALDDLALLAENNAVPNVASPSKTITVESAPTGGPAGEPTARQSSCDFSETAPAACYACDSQLIHSFKDDLFRAHCSQCGAFQATGLHININARVGRLKNAVQQAEQGREDGERKALLRVTIAAMGIGWLDQDFLKLRGMQELDAALHALPERTVLAAKDTQDDLGRVAIYDAARKADR